MEVARGPASRYGTWDALEALHRTQERRFSQAPAGLVVPRDAVWPSGSGPVQALGSLAWARQRCLGRAQGAQAAQAWCTRHAAVRRTAVFV